VALVDKGAILGGTCLNVGCIPSKMLIFPADRIVEIQQAGKLGIQAEIKSIDFRGIMERMRKSIAETMEGIRKSLKFAEELDFYEGEGHFVEDYTLEVNGEKIKGKFVVLASGSRPLIPPIPGLKDVPYLTNESVLQLDEPPESLILVGGGYIGVEYGHFFAAMGTKVTILEMANRLVLAEEPEVSALLKEELSKRMSVRLNTTAQEIAGSDKGVRVKVKSADGKQDEIAAEKIMIAVGRRSNADWLKLENTGVETDEKGFIKVNEYLETTKKNIYAVGDANGKQMFTHVANREASLVAHNVLHDARVKMDYSAVPHAVYSSPQIAAVGMTEDEARKKHKVLVGRASYFDVAKGEAMMEKQGFAKAIAAEDSAKILGFHIIGPYAPILIQEVINAMTSGGNIDQIGAGMHIHPALPELIQRTLANLHRH
jgi:mycothione reductase